MQNNVIYLIRHSIPIYEMIDGRRVMYGPEALLTEEGKQKARKLGEEILALEGKPFDFIYSSPLRRAHETAYILAEQMGLNSVISLNDLRDTDSIWGGTPMDVLMEVGNAGHIFDDPRTHETLSEIAERMTNAFNQITSSHEGQLIGIVSHGDPLRLLYNRIRYPHTVIPPYPQLVNELTLDMAQGIRLEISPKGENQSSKNV